MRVAPAGNPAPGRLVPLSVSSRPEPTISVDLRKLFGLGPLPATPGRSSGRPTPVPGRRPTPVPGTVVHDELLVTPADLAAGCSATPGRVVVQAETHLSRGHRARLLVTTGDVGPFQLTGTVAEVVAGQGKSSVELEIDADQRATLLRLLDWMAGRAPRPRPRERRYRMALPAFVTWPSGNAYMTTATVSTGGCGLAWSGAPPAVGQQALVRIGSGNASATFLSRICWVQADPRGARAGVRFVSGDGAALTALILQHGRRELAT